MIAVRLPTQIDVVAIVMMVSWRTAAYFLYLRWRAKRGTLGGALDGALRS